MPGERDEEILIVEDSLSQAMTLERTLRKRFARTHVCTDGNMALAAMSRSPALVLSDIVMPGMDGFQLCAAIKADPATRDIPVVLLTSLTGAIEVVRALECLADNFIFKPYREAHLLSVVEKTLDQKPGEDAAGGPVEISLGLRKFSITAGRRQILNLLLTTYESLVEQNTELANAQRELRYLAQSLEELVTEKSVELQSALSRLREAERVRSEGEEAMC